MHGVEIAAHSRIYLYLASPPCLQGACLPGQEAPASLLGRRGARLFVNGLPNYPEPLTAACRPLMWCLEFVGVGLVGAVVVFFFLQDFNFQNWSDPLWEIF